MPYGGLMKTKEAVHPRNVALGLPSPPPWAQKPLQNKRRRGRGDGEQVPGVSQASPPPPPPSPPPAYPSNRCASWSFSVASSSALAPVGHLSERCKRSTSSH